MDENREKETARILGDILDGTAGVEVAADNPGALDALATTGALRRGFGGDTGLSPDFDARLRARLIAESERLHKPLAVWRRPWVRASLMAAMLFIFLTPSWFYMQRRGDSAKSGQLTPRQVEKLENYDKMYEPRIDRLRDRLDRGEVRMNKFMKQRQERRMDRIEQLKHRRLEQKTNAVEGNET
jgi:hypothetical protein